MDLPSKKLVIIMAALKQQHGEQFEGCGVAFDGRAIVCKCYYMSILSYYMYLAQLCMLSSSIPMSYLLIHAQCTVLSHAHTHTG
jgi:hypothetical protein